MRQPCQLLSGPQTAVSFDTKTRWECLSIRSELWQRRQDGRINLVTQNPRQGGAGGMADLSNVAGHQG
jgi:hypothetical protein